MVKVITAAVEAAKNKEKEKEKDKKAPAVLDH